MREIEREKEREQRFVSVDFKIYEMQIPPVGGRIVRS